MIKENYINGVKFRTLEVDGIYFDEDKEVPKDEPIQLFWDFGLKPVCIGFQVSKSDEMRRIF